jgi:hypothetical protein
MFHASPLNFKKPHQVLKELKLAKQIHVSVATPPSAQSLGFRAGIAVLILRVSTPPASSVLCLPLPEVRQDVPATSASK